MSSHNPQPIKQMSGSPHQTACAMDPMEVRANADQRLLVIDDSEDIQELVRIWLGEESLEFFSCISGEDGLLAAPQVRPDLILLDVDLPGINGFEVCRRLKMAAVTADIPVVFLTGASSTEEKLQGLELGAIDYVTKPFDPAELRARVRAALNTKRLMDLLSQKAVILQESEERFRVLAENSSDVISRHSPDGMFRYASPACSAVFGYQPDAMLGRSLMEFVHPDDLQAAQECWATTSAPGETRTLSFRFMRGDGQYVWLESGCRALIDPSTGAVREIHTSARDITLRKQMEYREQIRADVLQMIAGGNPLNDILRQLILAVEQQEPQAFAAGVMLNGGMIHHCAPNLPAAISFSIERQMYNLIARFSVLSAQTSERVILCDLPNDPAWETLRQPIAELGLKSCSSILILSRQRDASGAFSLYRRDNQYPAASTIELMKLASDLISVAVEHRQLTDQLTFQARHDSLTGLPNRAMFADRLEQALANSSRSGKPGAVITVDVDRFKHVNDTYGHQAGDEMLCQVARRLGRRLRKSDTLARMGGDEFALILSELAKTADADLVAKILIQEFATPIDLRGHEFFVSVSMGSAVFPQDGSDASALLKCADFALYRAKNDGRNTSRAFTPDMSEGAVERLELESALRQAVSNQELTLHYQPKVNLSGEIVGLEALVRWKHPTLGMIPPAKFIPLAEDTGLILQIGGWVLEEAARQTRQWMNAGIDVVPVAVNVSTVQFKQPDFIATISTVLNGSGIPGKWLEIELTETVLMRNMCDAADKLARLKDMHVDVAIDDFGTGYSSLAYLQRLSIDTLKIDHSFISTIESERSSTSGKTIIAAIVSMAKNLGLTIVAEGVETQAQRQFLLDLGCDGMQGYLFGRPAPAALIEPLLRRRPIPATHQTPAA
jgi:diguanylate cyclase (GGDEF)-like protein/PAS domain S-box-containing protein